MLAKSLILRLISLILVLAAGAVYAQPPDTATNSGTMIVEDFTDMVTAVDLGFNDFSGNMGAINGDYVRQMTVRCTETDSCVLHFEWDFDSQREVFTGLFLSLFGLTDTKATFDGSTVENVAFPEHSLDLNRIDGLLNEPGGPRSVREVCMELSYSGTEPLKLRTELKDPAGGLRFRRLQIEGSTVQQQSCWDFRDSQEYRIPDGTADLDLRHAKVTTVIIEERHVGDQVRNPGRGELDLHRIWFTTDSEATLPTDDQELLDLQERRAYQYFLDWSSRKQASQDIPQDRSTFGDLLSVGGVGFGLSAHVIAADRGWISRAQAARRVVNVLRILDNAQAFGHEPVGRLGYKGWFYHFLGLDGRRKLNFDFPETARDESLNTVELSSIDTGLAIMGILAAQSYFDHKTDPVEVEIHGRAQAVYDRVDWTFMLEPVSSQFYLGWKPLEPYEGPPFNVTDSDGKGKYSGNNGVPATLDYYTDEALILALLGAGSDTHPVLPETYYALLWDRNQEGLIRTYPGALFTYQFLHAFLDTRQLLPCQSVNWYVNSRQAILATIEYAKKNPSDYVTYGPNSWGISAAEGPYDTYHAYGAPPVSTASPPEEDGTITYYAMLSAAAFGDDLRQHALAALEKGWESHWHPRFGLPDAFNGDISQATPVTGTLRSEGKWVQRALFGIDQGPMLLHLENARSGLIWGLTASNLNIQRGIQRIGALATPALMTFEGEDGSGDGQIMFRSNASGGQTLRLQPGETRSLPFSIDGRAQYVFTIRYSNADFASSETISLQIDGESIGQIPVQDTGDSEQEGWNTFVSGTSGEADVKPGSHMLSVTVSGGGGAEIDVIYLNRVSHCSFLPAIRQVDQ